MSLVPNIYVYEVSDKNTGKVVGTYSVEATARFGADRQIEVLHGVICQHFKLSSVDAVETRFVSREHAKRPSPR